MISNDFTKKALTTDETANYLGVSKSCLYKLTANRQIPYYKSPTGKLNYFKLEDIENWALSYRVSTETELDTKSELLTRK